MKAWQFMHQSARVTGNEIISKHSPASTKSAAQVLNPFVRDFPWDEVSAMFMGCDVDMVIPRSAIAVEKMLYAIFGRDTRRIFVTHEGYFRWCLNDWQSIMCRCPWIAVIVHIDAH
ncbi:hypothetical protein VN24_22775 [Paenibacillus beijingensis]|uniref:Uncharacterized protein n=1 Tax=Paenibacillus beijingensis TaxID=1126833 RepID=A0A0D5NPC5_9BACL|nr:hypothetical protein VN24_22775 [Paenibacillus beijingensis]